MVIKTLQKALDFVWGYKREQPVKTLTMDDLPKYSAQLTNSPVVNTLFDGDKFFGGFGATQLQFTDYWTLRARSAQLFNENLYARGLIRRLVTNEINTGLTPEACPDEKIIGLAEDSLADWSETVESRFGIWSKNPELCDWEGRRTYGELQRDIRREALIGGDVLVVLRFSRRTRLPRLQVILGESIRTPLGADQDVRKGHEIRHGVEFNRRNRIVAYWIVQQDNSFKRLPAEGERSGRKLAWLVYGTDRRMDEVRGQPMLSLILQSLKEIDRYRDSAQRKAVINSMIAMFIQKDDNKPSTLPVSGGAVRKDAVATTDGDGSKRTFNIASQLPGMVMEELQTGEKPVAFGNDGTDINFALFESAVLNGIAWAHEVPAEILTLAFTNNYSASQAAINEFKIYLNMRWTIEGETLHTPIYIEFLISETLTQKINAPGLLDAWRDPEQYDVFGAWTAVDWYGSIKPSTDMLKQAKGSKVLVAEGWSTNAREARVTTGTKYSKNIKRLQRENQQKADALRPLLKLKAEFSGSDEPTETDVKLNALIEDSIEALTDDLRDELTGT